MTAITAPKTEPLTNLFLTSIIADSFFINGDKIIDQGCNRILEINKANKC